MMYNIFILYVILLFAVRCKKNSATDEETGIIEELEFPDFSPFMGHFHKYKRDMSETAKIAFMTNGIESLRNNELMRGLIDRMFNFDIEVDLLEREIFYSSQNGSDVQLYGSIISTYPSIF